MNLLDVDGILVCSVLQNRLLEIQERPLVRHLLSHLHAGSPCVVCVALCAIRALVVVLCVFHFEALLHDGAVTDFRLHRDLDLDTPRMRLRPDEAGIDDSQLVESSQFLEAESEELTGFGRGNHPRVGRRQPSVAVAAHVQGCFALDAACRVRLEFYAIIAECAGRLCSVDGGTAVCAKNGRCRLRCGREGERGVDLHGGGGGYLGCRRRNGTL